MTKRDAELNTFGLSFTATPKTGEPFNREKFRDELRALFKRRRAGTTALPEDLSAEFEIVADLIAQRFNRLANAEGLPARTQAAIRQRRDAITAARRAYNLVMGIA